MRDIVEYVIGIDSGGTHYRVQAENLDGNVLGLYIGNYAAHYTLPEEEVRRRINHHIDACLARFNGRREDCRYLACGTTGLDSEEDGVFLQEIYQGLKGFRCPMTIKNDAELAHYTVTGGTGILVISGTGSIAYGVNRQGQARRVGGWSFSIMGEEGSGTWVTRKSIRYLADCFDGVRTETLMADLIKNRLCIHTIKEMTDYSASLTMDTHGQISLGELVDRAAEQGDENAISILKAAAKETFGLVDSLIRVLKMENDPEIAVGIWGSNIVQSHTHTQEFERLLLEKYPQAYVKKPSVSAVEGAARMAREMLRRQENTNVISV